MTSPMGLHRNPVWQHARPRNTQVFTVFNIGTGHTQQEDNNTVAILGRACQCANDEKVINDGVGGEGKTGKLQEVLGWGMNTAYEATMNSIRDASPAVVNMVGHSRGAILCHMLAHGIFKNPATRHIKINLFAIDPVHMSLVKHSGAERLDDNPNLLCYRAIVMENENSHGGGFVGTSGHDNTMFPFKFVRAPEQVKDRMHFINMPGTHGSGTQPLTSAIGRIVLELASNFLRFRGSPINLPMRSTLDMCDLFAKIHEQNPLLGNGKRMIRNDSGFDVTHTPGSEAAHSPGRRALDVRRVLEFNEQHGGRSTLPAKPSIPYFFNQEHAYYFKQAFPYLFSVLAAAPQRTKVDNQRFQCESQILDSRKHLKRTGALLYDHLFPYLY